MATQPKTNRVTQTTGNSTLKAGLEKHQSTLPFFTYGSETLTTPDVIASLVADNSAAAAVAPAKAAWQAKVQAARTQATQTRAMVAKVTKALLVQFAGQPEVLVDFGLTEPKPPTPLTTEQRVAANAKARATRAARKTMGSQQKKAVTGNVTGVTVTPIVEAPVAAATGSPPPAGPTARPQ